MAGDIQVTVACIGCGACCRDNVPVLDADPTPRELTEMRGDRRWMKPHATKPWCGALDLATRSCTVYENRPSICREFQRGAPECKRAVERGR